MGNQRAPEGDMLLELLTWEWQPADDVIDKIIPRVAPGRALRQYEKEAINRAAKVKGDGPLRPASESHKIRSGARSLVNRAVRSLIQSNEVEQRGLGGFGRTSERAWRRVERRRSREHLPHVIHSPLPSHPSVVQPVAQPEHTEVPTGALTMHQIVQVIQDQIDRQTQFYKRTNEAMTRYAARGDWATYNIQSKALALTAGKINTLERVKSFLEGVNLKEERRG